jgi:hypothetical protein
MAITIPASQNLSNLRGNNFGALSDLRRPSNLKWEELIFHAESDRIGRHPIHGFGWFRDGPESI